jgi:hypothetical protein
LTIREAFALNPLEELPEALASGVMPRVPAEGKFVGVPGQMLPGNMMPSSDDRSFEQGKE